MAQGVGSQQRAAVTYAGRADWQILRVESANASLAGQAVQKARIPGPVTRVEYELLVTLKADAAAGSLRDEVILVTNDANPQKARVPVPVEATIQPAIAVHPSPLLMGSVAPGAVAHPATDRSRQQAVSRRPGRVERQAVPLSAAGRRRGDAPSAGDVCRRGRRGGRPSECEDSHRDRRAAGAPLEVGVSVQVTQNIAAPPPANPSRP